MRVVKGDWNRTVFVITVKTLVPCRRWDWRDWEPYEMSVACEPDRWSNFFSPPAHLCAVTYITEYSWMWRHGSHRSWHTFFKDFSRTFEVHFQGVFKDFSLFFQTSTGETMINNGNKTCRDHLTLSSKEKWGEGRDLGRCFQLKKMICCIMVIIQAKTNLLERGVWRSSPRKFFIRISTKSRNSRQFSRVH